MNHRSRPLRGPALCLIGAALAGVLAGCRSYERAPLDLVGHAADFQRRATVGEPLRAFAARLASSGGPAPERFDPADGLSPAEGEVLALFFNADLRLARLDAGIALADFQTAGLWRDPEFGFDAAEVLSPAGVFEYGLTLSLTIPVSGRLGVEEDRAGAAYEAELRRLVDAEWSVRAEVRSAWAEWGASAERVRLLGEAGRRTERITLLTDRLEEAGELTRIESRLIRAEALAVKADLIAARHAEVGARLRLFGLMGLPADAGVDLLPSFRTADIPNVADDARRLIEHNTELAVRRAEYGVAEQELRLEVRKQYPDITIGTGYGNEGDDRLLLGVSFPIPILNANRAGIAEARARRDLARAAAETTFERLARELAAARAEARAVREQRGAVEAELIPLLEQQAVEVERIVELGEVDTPLLLETVTRGFEARAVLLELRVREIRAINEIARLLGPSDAISPAPVRPSSDVFEESVGSAPEEARR